MNRLNCKDDIFIVCISFTIVAVIFSLLAYATDMFMDLKPVNYLELFSCNVLIAFLMHLTSYIKVESQIVANFIHFLNTAVVIFGVGGGIYQWFSWKFKNIVLVIAILIITFFITNLIMIWNNREVAKSINNKIKERRNEIHD